MNLWDSRRDQNVVLLRGCDTTVTDVRFVSEFEGLIVYTVVRQILFHRVSVAKGTDVDKPRNLAKSLTVE